MNKTKINFVRKTVGKLMNGLPKPQLYYLDFRDSFLKEFFKGRDEQSVLNLGCGETRYGRNHVNMDVMPSRTVDIVADAHKLPFQADTFDVVFSGAVLEHIRKPFAAVEEIYRVLLPGGKALITIPFLAPYHVCPGTKDDYFRVTKEGCGALFANFMIQEIGILSGPATAFCLIAHGLAETLLLRIMRSEGVVALIMIFVDWFLYPFKFLDKFLIKLPESHKYAAMFYVIATKGTK